jgi:hypothetical protein
MIKDEIMSTIMTGVTLLIVLMALWIATSYAKDFVDLKSNIKQSLQ